MCSPSDVLQCFAICALFMFISERNASVQEADLSFTSPREIRTIDKCISSEHNGMQEIAECTRTRNDKYEIRTTDDLLIGEKQKDREKLLLRNRCSCNRELSSYSEGKFMSAERYFDLHTVMAKPTDEEIENLYRLMLQQSSTLSSNEVRETRANITRLCSNPAPIFYGGDLRCKYNFNNSPFLRIAPLKEEILSLDPKITVFRDVLYDSEIEVLMREGKNRIFEKRKTKEKSLKINSESNQRDLEFIKDEDFEVIQTVTRRTRDLSGHLENFLQPWQITFYGVGGYFPVHSDLDHADAEEVEKQGQRLATVSYCLHNADMGGETVFPRINVKPELYEKDAVMWYNLLNDGTEDIRIRHALCPLGNGQKWELIKRINEKLMPMENN